MKSREFHEALLWKAELLERKHEINIICKHHELLFGEAFVRRNDKCCGVLKLHRRKVIGDRLVTLEMAQTLRTKGITVTPGKKFCRTCIAQYHTITADDETKPQEAEPEDAAEESIDEDFGCETPKVNTSLSAVECHHSICMESHNTVGLLLIIIRLTCQFHLKWVARLLCLF